MQEAKKRGRKDADELQLLQRGKAAAASKSSDDAPALSKPLAAANKSPVDAAALSKSITAANKTIGEAPALSKSIAPPAILHKPSSAAAGVSRPASAAAAVVIAAAAAAVATVGAPAAAVQSRQPAASALFEMLRGELRKRQMAVPSQLSSEMDDGSMLAAVHLAETLYVDEILKETSGNVSLAGKIAKIT